MQRSILATLSALSLSASLLATGAVPAMAAAPTKTSTTCAFERTVDVVSPTGFTHTTYLQLSAACEHLAALQSAQVTYSVSEQRLHGKDQVDVQIGIVAPDDTTVAAPVYSAASVARTSSTAHKALDSASGQSGQMMILHYTLNK